MNIKDSFSPEYRMIDDFLSDDELKYVLNQYDSITEDYWEDEFNYIYPKEHEVDKNYWQGIIGWKGMSINLNRKCLHHYSRMRKNNIDVDFFDDISNKSKKHIQERFGFKVMREDYTLNRWRVGREQRPHIDYIESEEDNDHNALNKHEMTKSYLDVFEKDFHTKHFATIIYLNDDFSGGDLYFPEHNNLIIKPKPKMSINLKGDSKNIHGVEMMTSGVRKTLSMFWTKQ
jgi:hypothetical protein